MRIDEPISFTLVPSEVFDEIKTSHKRIDERLDKLFDKLLTLLENPTLQINPRYITAQAFRDALGIKQWKFDQLVGSNSIKTVRKKRKIYVPASEIDRYFNDPTVP